MREYYEKKALNYSTLSALDSNNPGIVFREDEKKESTEAMNRGSLVDCLLTSLDEFNNRFIIVEELSVTDNVKQIISKLVDANLDYTDANLLFVAKESNYGGNWKDETLLEKIKKNDSRKYFEEIKTETDKIKISQESYDKALNVIEVLKNHEFTSWIFSQDEGIEVKFQVPCYWRDKDLDCKALLDIVYINHNTKTIIPIDLKVKSDSVYNFLKSFVRFRYYLQAVWYSRGLVMDFMKDYPGYNLEIFRFLVTSFEYPDPPLIYMCTNEIIDIGINGGIINDKKVKGVIQLVDDYKWYINNQHNYSRQTYENKGVLNIIV